VLQYTDYYASPVISFNIEHQENIRKVMKLSNFFNLPSKIEIQIVKNSPTNNYQIQLMSEINNWAIKN